MNHELDGPPERPGRRMLLRSFAAALLIVLLTAGASATAGLMEVKDLLPGDDPAIAPPLERLPIVTPKPGKPQTLLLLGSDHRWADGEDEPARSDTMMLVRIDPEQKATTVLSIPRDLRVLIPGVGYTKINDAYAEGGPKLATEVVKTLTGLKINHVLNVNFKGFRGVVDLFDCFYVDVDRRYYHSNAGVPIGQRYAEIDIKAGYQQLCGQKALDYVRFRHSDNDLVRAARQQDFLRAAKDQVSTSSLIDDRKKLAHAFWRSAQSDKGLRSVAGFLRLAKLALGAADEPIRQLKFPATFVDTETGSYVEATQEQIDATISRFLHGGGADTSKPRVTVKRKPKQLAQDAHLVDARSLGRSFTAGMRKKTGFLVRFPAYLTPHGHYDQRGGGARTYTIRDRGGTRHRAYRLVVVENALEGQYYGVQGTTWRNPPLLAEPSERRVVHGRTLELFRAGRRLRLVAWRTSSAAYWISNTLNLRLDNDQMLALAASLTTK